MDENYPYGYVVEVIFACYVKEFVFCLNVGNGSE